MTPRRLLALPGGWPWLLASALLLGLAHPPFHLLFPSFLGLVPFALWLRTLPPEEEGRAEALRGGFFLGLVYLSLVYYWLVVALIFYTPLAVLAFVLPVLIISGFLALATLGMHLSMRRLGWPLWLALPVFWTAVEWLRGHLGDVSFPWMRFGETLTGFPWLVGVADLVGSRGVSFWLVLVNGLIAVLVFRWRPGWAPSRPAASAAAPEGTSSGAGSGDVSTGIDSGAGPRRTGRELRGVAVGLLLALMLPTAYSLARWHGLELRPAATVGVVQPNIPEDLKLRPNAAVDSSLRAMRTLADRELAPATGELDVVLFPETFFPVPLDPIPSLGVRGRPDLTRTMTQLAGELRSPIVYGAVGIRNLSGDDFDHFNSAYMTDSAGRRVAEYDKRRLVPIVERVPFVDPDWVQGLNEVFGGYFGGNTPGDPPEPMEAGDARFGVLICYESIFPELSRGYRMQGADFLVNLTNDAWFGREEPWWSRTSALWQHPAHLVMRAIENRIGIARSANTGISMMVDPLGRTSSETELFTDDAFVADVRTTDAVTLYTRFGDLVGLAAALAALGACITLGLRERKRR